jgi:dTDP-4-dehydrorhamnose 3,5-epimerase-like enzyme|tara:strand:+ start:22981 stop:23418 length:438 start_codon:yes stop_codon:yes gene_type:complete
MNTTLEDVKILNLHSRGDNDRGYLVAIESLQDIPMDISRIFYVYGASGKNRGNHAHFKTRQVLICINGKAVVTCNDGKTERSFVLDSPNKGIFIPEMIWDSVSYLENDTILLALSDTHYDRRDYIEDIKVFRKIKDSLSEYNTRD